MLWAVKTIIEDKVIHHRQTILPQHNKPITAYQKSVIQHDQTINKDKMIQQQQITLPQHNKPMTGYQNPVFQHDQTTKQFLAYKQNTPIRQDQSFRQDTARTSTTKQLLITIPPQQSTPRNSKNNQVKPIPKPRLSYRNITRKGNKII